MASAGSTATGSFPGVHLRVTLIHPLPSDAELDARREALRAAARR